VTVNLHKKNYIITSSARRRRSVLNFCRNDGRNNRRHHTITHHGGSQRIMDLFPRILPAMTSTCLYTIRFLASAAQFTNHNYLFILLMVITVWTSGGGNALDGGEVASIAISSRPSTADSDEERKDDKRDSHGGSSLFKNSGCPRRYRFYSIIDDSDHKETPAHRHR